MSPEKLMEAIDGLVSSQADGSGDGLEFAKLLGAREVSVALQLI